MKRRAGPTFCWACGRRLMLATQGEHKGRFVWSVAVDPSDPDAREHTIHKQCAEGLRVVRDDVDLAMKPEKLRVWL